MLLEPLDADGLVIPDARPSAAWTAVMGLRSVSAGARDVGQRLTGAPGALTAWRGGAEVEYRQRRAELSGRVADLALVAEQGATVIHDWLVEADAAIAAMRTARDQVEAARLGEAAANAAGRYGTADLSLADHTAWVAWAQAKRRYWDGVEATAARLAGLRDGLGDLPPDGADQVDAFVKGTVGQFGAGLATVWGLTGQALVDPARWWRDVSSLPGQTWDAAATAFRHPVETAAASVDVDGWRHGRYGEAIAVGGTMFLPRPWWLRRGPDEGKVRFAGHLADARLPRPRLQTVDEMLDQGVDLTEHEHAEYGHAIRRHVDTGPWYLADRLQHGTLLDDGSRGAVPKTASSFPDLATANRYTTAALRQHEAQLRLFCRTATGAADEPALLLSSTWTEPVGQVMTKSRSGFSVGVGRRVVVLVKLTPDRQPFVYTSYVSR
jgi:hypothetical protein